MTRRKSIFKIISAVLAVLLLAVCFAGCGEYKPPENSGGGSTVTPPVDPNPPVDPDEDAYTVTLMLRDDVQETPFTNIDYPLITELQAQWTEITDGRPKMYSASFDKNGVAKVSGLAGDYKVTLRLTDRFKKLYTYDPNPAREERRDELVATRYKKDVSVPLYEIKPLGEVGQIAVLNAPKRLSYYTLTERGAYSYTFNSKDDAQLFLYSPKQSGAYSFFTLMDVTADEVNPLIDMYKGHVGNFVLPVEELDNKGGAAGNYTKNIWIDYNLPPDEANGTNCMAFNLHSESEKSDAYPITIYFLFEYNGEYSRPKVESVEVPVTEDFTKTPKTPDGQLKIIGEYDPVELKTNSRHILNQKNVKYNDPAKGGDGYYYYINPATGDFFTEEDGSVSAQYRVYAVLSEPIPVLYGAGRDGVDAYLTYGELTSSYSVMQGEDGTLKNYYGFIMGVNGYSRHCNRDGAYPVTAELKQFLQDFCISQRYFNDGNGFAENKDGANYNSDEDSQWLFACGVYVN